MNAVPEMEFIGRRHDWAGLARPNDAPWWQETAPLTFGHDRTEAEVGAHLLTRALRQDEICVRATIDVLSRCYCRTTPRTDTQALPPALLRLPRFPLFFTLSFSWVGFRFRFYFYFLGVFSFFVLCPHRSSLLPTFRPLMPATDMPEARRLFQEARGWESKQARREYVGSAFNSARGCLLVAREVTASHGRPRSGAAALGNGQSAHGQGEGETGRSRTAAATMLKRRRTSARLV